MSAPTPSRAWQWLRATVAAATCVAAVGAALAAGWHIASAPSGTAAIVPAGAKTTRVDLGRAICGECCETRIWRAVGNMTGVKDVATTVGRATIVVHHDGRAGLAPALVDALQTEWPTATLATSAAEAVPAAREWIRPVQPARAR